tara:strand:- start:488 stop:598 length:111 start_codon:yes stop_codon:yes gene_type:complete
LKWVLLKGMEKNGKKVKWSLVIMESNGKEVKIVTFR